MREISPKLASHLIKATMAKNIREAFHNVFSEFLQMKLFQLEKTMSTFEKKWNMNFHEFKKRLNDDTLGIDIYLFEVENDFWNWEEVFTLKQHYEKVKKE